MQTIQVNAVKKAPSGKSLIVEGAGANETYFAKVSSGIAPGMTISAEVEESEYNGKTNLWIGKWQPASGTPAETDRTSAAPNPNRAIEEPSRATTGYAPWFMPFVSNVCGNGMRSGVIDSPEKLAQFAAAAHQVAIEIGGSK